MKVNDVVELVHPALINLKLSNVSQRAIYIAYDWYKQALDSKEPLVITSYEPNCEYGLQVEINYSGVFVPDSWFKVKENTKVTFNGGW